MTTRNLTMVLHNGEYKVAQYGQWDGYPSGQGMEVHSFVKNMDINKMRQALNNVRFIIQDDINQINTTIDTEGNIDGDRWIKKYPALSRDICAEILAMIYNTESELLLHNDIDFAADSLFCEWLYLINLDDETLEVYKGSNKTPLNESDRFYFLSDKAEGEYSPVKIVKSYPLNELPDGDAYVADLTESEDNK